MTLMTLGCLALPDLTLAPLCLALAATLYGWGWGAGDETLRRAPRWLGLYAGSPGGPSGRLRRARQHSR